MSKYKTMDANEAVARVAYKFTEVAGIYPITPASPMAEKIDVLSSNNEINFWGNKVKIVEMQSEAGAAAMVHGALQSGALSSTFTASQGLLLMIPTLYKLAGEMLPGVIHVAARSLSTHSLSIFGDHQDIYAVRQTGVCMLSSASPEEAYHMAMVSHLASIKSSLPFINFFDGFRTSHEIDKVNVLELDDVKDLVDNEALNKFKSRALSPNVSTTIGTNQNDDIYFQATEVRNKYYDRIMMIMIIVQAFDDMIIRAPEYIIRRDVFDLRTIQYIFDSCGVEFFPDIPLKYQKRLVKNLNRLIKYKSCDKNLIDISKLFGFDNIQLFKYWLMKVPLFDENGEYRNPYKLTKEWLEKYDITYDKLFLVDAYNSHLIK